MRLFGIQDSGEKDLVAARPTADEESREAAGADHPELLREREELVRENKELQREREELVRERQQFVRDRKELQGVYEGLLDERQELVREHKDLRGAYEDLLRERTQLSEEVGKLEEVLRGRELEVGEQERAAQERTQLLEKVGRLEDELTRYREETGRPSKLFLLATNYAESVRESARRDAELALRKARSRAEKMLVEQERARMQAERELRRLQALTGEIRDRLSAFTTAALQLVSTEVEAGTEDDSEPALHDLQDALQTKLPSATRSAATTLREAEIPER